MSDNDQDFLAGVTPDNATLLLAAAEEFGLDARVVQVDYSRGGFTAPAKVVKRASSGDEKGESESDKSGQPDGELPPKSRRKKE